MEESNETLGRSNVSLVLDFAAQRMKIVDDLQCFQRMRTLRATQIHDKDPLDLRAGIAVADFFQGKIPNDPRKHPHLTMSMVLGEKIYAVRQLILLLAHRHLTDNQVLHGQITELERSIARVTEHTNSGSSTLFVREEIAKRWTQEDAEPE